MRSGFGTACYHIELVHLSHLVQFHALMLGRLQYAIDVSLANSWAFFIFTPDWSIRFSASFSIQAMADGSTGTQVELANVAGTLSSCSVFRVEVVLGTDDHAAGVSQRCKKCCKRCLRVVVADLVAGSGMGRNWFHCWPVCEV